MAKLTRKAAPTLADKVASHKDAGVDAVLEFHQAASKLEKAAEALRETAEEAQAEADALSGLAFEAFKASDAQLEAATKIRSLFSGIKG